MYASAIFSKSKHACYRIYCGRMEAYQMRTTNTVSSFRKVCTVNNQRSGCTCVRPTARYYCSTVTASQKTIDNVEVETKEFNKLRKIHREIAGLINGGFKVPNKLQDRDYEELLKIKTYQQRLSYLRYLWKKEVAIESKKIEKVKSRVAVEERKSEFYEIRANCSHIVYGFGGNFMFQRIYEAAMNEFYNYRQAYAVLYGQCIVLDLGFDNIMTEKDCKYTMMQIPRMYRSNKLNHDPYYFHICNVANGSQTMNQLKRFMPNIKEPSCLVNVTEKSYLDLFPKEKLVYLTPDSANVLEAYDNNDVYIIGGFADKKVKPGVTLNKAEMEGIRTARLPLDHYLDWESINPCLAMNQVMDILLTMKDTGDWEQALQHVPKRKLKVEFPWMLQNQSPESIPAGASVIARNHLEQMLSSPTTTPDADNKSKTFRLLNRGKWVASDEFLETRVGEGMNTESPIMALQNIYHRIDINNNNHGWVDIADVQEIIKQLEVKGTVNADESHELLRSCGSVLCTETVETRTKLTERVWRLINNMGIRLTLKHYLILLRVYFQNFQEFSTQAMLDEMIQRGIQPTKLIHLLMIGALCQRGEVERARELQETYKLQRKKHIGLELQNYVILGYVRKGDLVAAHEAFRENYRRYRRPDMHSYNVLMIGYAEEGDIAAVRKLFDQAKHDGVEIMDSTCLKMVFNLITARFPQYVDEVLSQCPRRAWFSRAVLITSLHLLSHGHPDFAIKMFQLLAPDFMSSSGHCSAPIFTEQMVRFETPVEKMMKFIDAIEDTDLRERSFHSVLESALNHHKLDIFLQLKRILSHRGQEVKVDPDVVKKSCENLLILDKIDELERLVAALGGVVGVNREQLLYYLLRGYCVRTDVPSSLDVWTRFSEEQVEPSYTTMVYLAEFLQRQGFRVPFDVPTSPRVKPPSSLDEALEKEDAESALEFKNRMDTEGRVLSKKDMIRLIDLLFHKDKLQEAMTVIDVMRRSKAYPSMLIIKAILTSLAKNGEVSKIKLIADILPAALKTAVELHNFAGIAHINRGSAVELLESLEEDPTNRNFPNIAVIAMLERHPQLLGRVTTLAERYSRLGDPLPYMTIWSYHMQHEEYPQAERVFTDHILQHENHQLDFLPIIRKAELLQNEEMVRRLITFIKEYKTSQYSGIGMAYGTLIEVLCLTDQNEEAASVLRTALTEGLQICNFHKHGVHKLFHAKTRAKGFRLQYDDMLEEAKRLSEQSDTDESESSDDERVHPST